jgi:hypothetical protein
MITYSTSGCETKPNNSTIVSKSSSNNNRFGASFINLAAGGRCHTMGRDYGVICTTTGRITDASNMDPDRFQIHFLWLKPLQDQLIMGEILAFFGLHSLSNYGTKILS